MGARWVKILPIVQIKPPDILFVFKSEEVVKLAIFDYLEVLNKTFFLGIIHRSEKCHKVNEVYIEKEFFFILLLFHSPNAHLQKFT